MRKSKKTTLYARNLCLYMSLGDGCMLSEGRIKISHCEKQLGYLKWKKNMLEKAGIDVSDIKERVVKSFGGEYKQYYFRTKNYKFIQRYRKVVYSPKKNLSRKSILNRLTPLALAILYMDDGTLHFNKKPNGGIKTLHITIATALNKEDTQKLINTIKTKYDINFHCTKMPCKKSTNLYQLRCTKAESEKFIALIKDYVSSVPEMLYKINTHKDD